MNNNVKHQKLKIEKKIYELLGIKVFRKLVFTLEKFLHIKDKKKNINYHLKQKNLSSIQDFKKYLFYNGSIHIRNLIRGIIIIPIMLLFSINTIFIISLIALLIKDLYCVMLQRYNWIRICETEKKLQAHRERKIAKEEIKEYNSIKENAEKQKIAEEIELLKQFKQFVIEKNNTEIMEDKTNVVIRLNKCKNKIRRKENE